MYEYYKSFTLGFRYPVECGMRREKPRKARAICSINLLL